MASGTYSEVVEELKELERIMNDEMTNSPFIKQDTDQQSMMEPHDTKHWVSNTHNIKW